MEGGWYGLVNLKRIYMERLLRVHFSVPFPSLLQTIPPTMAQTIPCYGKHRQLVCSSSKSTDSKDTGYCNICMRIFGIFEGNFAHEMCTNF